MSKQRKQSPRDAARPENKVSFDEVTALVKERKKYVDWIAALEAKREQTPEHVYAKVHLDYETRLQAVLDKLSAHRGTLSEERELLRRKLEGVGEQIEAANERRSETELRAHVGELSAAALTEALRVADTEIERLEAKHASIETDLEKIEEFFAALEGTGRVSKPTQRQTSGFDELGFLQSVVGAEKGKPGSQAKAETPVAESAPPLRPVEVPSKPAEMPAPSRPTPPSTPTPEPTPEPNPEPKREPAPPPAPEPKPEPKPEPPVVPVPEQRRSVEKQPEVAQADGVVEKATELEGPSPAAKAIPRQSIAIQMASLTLEPGTDAKAQSDLGIIKTGDELPPSILADLQPGSGGAKPLAANIASNNPLSLKGSAPSDLKTLKCKECGSMNDPSEWYCERCGAELSAI